MEKKRVLCVCQCGHSRSAALVRILHKNGYPAIACGAGTAGNWLPRLCQDADVIVLMQEQFRPYIMPLYHPKIKVMDIGIDVWSNPFNQQLLDLVEGRLHELEL